MEKPSTSKAKDKTHKPAKAVSAAPPEVAKAEGSGKAKSAQVQPVAKVVVAPEPEQVPVADKHVADKPASPPVKVSKPSDDVVETTALQDPPAVTGETEHSSAEETIEAVAAKSPHSVSPVDPTSDGEAHDVIQDPPAGTTSSDDLLEAAAAALRSASQDDGSHSPSPERE